MERLTYFDYIANCYKIKPEAAQGKIIQNLGAYEHNVGTDVSKELDSIIEMLEAEKMDEIEGTDSYNEGLKVAIEIVEGVKASCCS